MENLMKDDLEVDSDSGGKTQVQRHLRYPGGSRTEAAENRKV